MIVMRSATARQLAEARAAAAAELAASQQALLDKADLRTARDVSVARRRRRSTTIARRSSTSRRLHSKRINSRLPTR